MVRHMYVAILYRQKACYCDNTTNTHLILSISNREIEFV